MGCRARALWCVAVFALASFACSENVEQVKRDYVERGDRYIAEKNVDAAIIEYRNAVQRDPQFGEAHRKLASAYASRGDGADALRAAVTAADLLPDSVEAQTVAGEMLLLAGRFADAKLRAQRALGRDASFTRARVLLGNSIAGLKDIDSAIKEFEEAIRLDPDQSGVYTGLASLKAAQGDLQAAEQAFKQAIDQDPDAVLPRLALAQFYWSTERLADSEQTLKTTLASAPTDSLANLAMAVFYQAAGRADEAEPYLRAAVRGDDNPRLKIATADYYIAHRRPDDAKPLLAPLAQDRRFGALASLRLAGIAQVEGRPEEALQILDDRLTVEPKNALVLAAKSDVLRLQRKLDEAVKVADAAVAAGPTSAHAHFARGRILAERGQREQAERAFNDVLRLNPRAAAARVELARLNVSTNAEEAIAQAQQASKDDPQHGAARLVLARALIQRQDYDAAEKVLDELLKAGPNIAGVHAELGVLYARRNDVTRARAAFARALALEPTHVDAIEALAAVDFATGRRAEALALIEHALATAPDDSRLLIVAAKAYASADNLASAERMLLKAIEKNPSALAAYATLGQVYLSQKKLASARAQFVKVAASQERPITAYTVIGIIDLMEDRVADAQQAFERVITMDPRSAVAANNLAWIYAEHGGSLEMALQLAEVAQAGMPNDAEVHDTLGWIYYKKGRITEAVSTLQRSLELEPRNATAAYHLALVHEQNGDRLEARRLMTHYLSLDSTSDRSVDVRRRLQQLGT
jgi:tetratricopeptide (TPR) repeat protein